MSESVEVQLITIPFECFECEGRLFHVGYRNGILILTCDACKSTYAFKIGDFFKSFRSGMKVLHKIIGKQGTG